MGDPIGQNGLAISNHMVRGDVVRISKEHSIVIFVEDAHKDRSVTPGQVRNTPTTFSRHLSDCQIITEVWGCRVRLGTAYRTRELRMHIPIVSAAADPLSGQNQSINHDVGSLERTAASFGFIPKN